MSTLTEIEAAVEMLPRKEQEILRAHLVARLGASSAPANARLEALDALQSHLGLNASKSREWLATVRDARR